MTFGSSFLLECFDFSVQSSEVPSVAVARRMQSSVVSEHTLEREVAYKVSPIKQNPNIAILIPKLLWY